MHPEAQKLSNKHRIDSLLYLNDKNADTLIYFMCVYVRIKHDILIYIYIFFYFKEIIYKIKNEIKL